MKRYNHIIVIGVVIIVLLQGSRARGVEMNEGSHAIDRMGMGLVVVSFPSRGEVWDVSLKWSVDGQTFGSANIGLPRPWNLFRSVSYDQQQTTVLIPVAGFFATNPKMLLFQDSGRHWFRVQVNFRDASKPRNAPYQVDKTIEPVVIEQILDVGPAIQADLDFIAGLADADLIRAMFGEDFFERQVAEAREYYADPEVRAVMVIGRLLYATREKWVGDVMREAGPKGDIQQTARALLTLARKIPDSSYAPYAAYYAGCCYSATCITEAVEATRARRKEGGFPDELDEGKYRAALIKRDEASAKAYEAFTLAARRADAYLKARALYQHGNLRLVAFDFDQSESLLAKATEAAPGEGTVQEWIGEARKGIEVGKARLQDPAKEEGEQQTP